MMARTMEERMEMESATRGRRRKGEKHRWRDDDNATTQGQQRKSEKEKRREQEDERKIRMSARRGRV